MEVGDAVENGDAREEFGAVTVVVDDAVGYVVGVLSGGDVYDDVSTDVHYY